MIVGIVLSLIVGLSIGSVLGVIATSMVVVGKKTDERLENQLR